MTDCSNVEICDLLPDLLHGRLSAADRARVEAHLASCGGCSAELSLLRGARRMSAAGVPAVDVATVVGRLPTPPRSASVVARGGADAVSMDAARRTRAARRRVPMAGWRRAAAIAAIVAGGAAAAVLRGGHSTGAEPARRTVLAPEAPALAVAGAGGGAVGARGTDSAAPAQRQAVASGGPGLALDGAESDLSEDALVALLAGLDALDGAPDVEPAPALPDMTGEDRE